jgi:hypothetical protein
MSRRCVAYNIRKLKEKTYLKEKTIYGKRSIYYGKQYNLEGSQLADQCSEGSQLADQCSEGSQLADQCSEGSDKSSDQCSEGSQLADQCSEGSDKSSDQCSEGSHKYGTEVALLKASYKNNNNKTSYYTNDGKKPLEIPPGIWNAELIPEVAKRIEYTRNELLWSTIYRWQQMFTRETIKCVYDEMQTIAECKKAQYWTRRMQIRQSEQLSKPATTNQREQREAQIRNAKVSEMRRENRTENEIKNYLRKAQEEYPITEGALIGKGGTSD